MVPHNILLVSEKYNNMRGMSETVQRLVIGVIALMITLNQGYSQCAKFEPPYGHALLIIGQDLNAIGGMPDIGYTNGYLDHVGGPTPGGFTQYTSINGLQGISSVTTDCSGHNYMDHMMSNSTFDNSALAIGLYCGGMIDDIAAGNYIGFAVQKRSFSL